MKNTKFIWIVVIIAALQALVPIGKSVERWRERRREAEAAAASRRAEDALAELKKFQRAREIYVDLRLREKSGYVLSREEHQLLDEATSTVAFGLIKLGKKLTVGRGLAMWNRNEIDSCLGLSN